MKNIITVSFLTVCICSFANAQNLLPNPDFEEYNDCPTSYSGINTNKCSDWSCIAGSPDYFNCSFYGTPGGGVYGVPSTGSGLVGMWGLINNIFCNGELQRESISASLIKPLKACKKYRISFDIRLDKTGSASIPGFGHDCLDFGFYFYSGGDPNICSNSCNCWNVEPQISVSSSQIPLNNYITFTFEFISEDDYDKVAIGPFCNEKLNLPECYALPSNDGPFQLYFNLDNIVLEQINTNNQIGISTNNICQNDSIMLWENLIDSVFSWNWNIPGAIQNSSNGQLVSFSFPFPGKYSIELITQSNCGIDTIQLLNHIQVHPVYERIGLDTSITICKDAIFSIPNPKPSLKYFWSDNTIGSKRKFESSGLYKVIVEDDFGCHNDSFSISVELINEMIVYPNPTNTTWSSKNTLSIPNRIQLYDALGRVIYIEENVNKLEIDIKKLFLMSSIYFLVIEVNNCKKIEKVIYVR